MIWGVTGGVFTDTFRAIRGSFTGDFESVGEGTIGNIRAGWNKMNNAYDHIGETYSMYEKNELEEYAKAQKQLLERLDYIGKNQNTFGVPVEKDFVMSGSQALGVSTSIPNFTSNNTYNYDYSRASYDYSKSINESTKFQTTNSNYNSIVNEYKKNNEAIKVELPEAINNLSKIKETKSIDKKSITEVKKEIKPNVLLNDDYSVVLKNITKTLSSFKEPKNLNAKTVQETKKMIKPEVTLANTPTYNTNVTINEATDGAKIEKMIETGIRGSEKQNIEKLKAQLGVVNYGFGY